MRASRVAKVTVVLYSFGPYTNLKRTLLLPELKQYLVGIVLQHPLLRFEYAYPGLAARLNQLYEHRLRTNGRTSDDLNEWERLRPELGSFERSQWYLKKLLNDGVACDQRLAGLIWTDPELVTNSCDVLSALVDFPIPSSPVQSFMVERERLRLAELPDEIQIFRGHVPMLEQRLSWTLNPKVALGWACRREPEDAILGVEDYGEIDRQFFMPVVTVGTVRKSQILAFVDRRHEDEILVDPQYVNDRQSFAVTSN